MSRSRLVKVVIRVSPQLALKYEQLAQRFGYTRTELYRLGLDHGLSSVTKWCDRSSGDFGELAEQSLNPSIDSDTSLALESQTPLGRLAIFAQSLVASDFAADRSRVSQELLDRAETVGLSRTQAEPYVHALASDVVRSASRGRAARGRQSGTGSSRSSVRRVAPSAASSPSDPTSSSSSLDDVPELD